MSAETTPKLETFLIVAYKPLRDSDQRIKPPLTESEFNTKVANFRISEKANVFTTELEGLNRTCVVAFGRKRNAALVAIENSRFYIDRGQSRLHNLQLTGAQHFGACDLVLVWKDKLAVALGQSKFSVADLKTSKVLFQSSQGFICKIATYSGHSYYSAYGRGAKIFNDCVLMATNLKKMTLIPLRQFWDHKRQVGIERETICFHEFKDVESVLDVDGLEDPDGDSKCFRYRQPSKYKFNQVSCLTSSGSLSVVEVGFRRLLSDSLSTIHTVILEDKDQHHRVIEAPIKYLLKNKKLYSSPDSTCNIGKQVLTQEF